MAACTPITVSSVVLQFMRYKGLFGNGFFDLRARHRPEGEGHHIFFMNKRFRILIFFVITLLK